jgi:UDP:flavonoid glycosyltransferase YjiC (YdhE family)
MSFRESIRRRAGRQPSPGRGTCHVSAPQPRPGGSTTTSPYAHGHGHGGSGTADGALAAGVPVVVVPLFADQFENGRRLADGGAGLVVAATEATDAPRSSPDRAGGRAPRIAAGITSVLATPSDRRNARRIAAEMASARTADEVLAALLRPR